MENKEISKAMAWLHLRRRPFTELLTHPNTERTITTPITQQVNQALSLIEE